MAPQGVPVLVLVHEPLLEQVPLVPVAVQAWPTPMQVRVAIALASVTMGRQQPLLHAFPAQQG